MPAPEPSALPTLATHRAEAIERAWRERVYRGADVPQLTARALLTGAGLGALTGLSNLYVGLKVGWSMGVVVTASVLGWGLWRLAARLRIMRRPTTVLEANAMASTASAAGYSTGALLPSAMAAHLMVTGQHLPLWQLALWVLSVSILGLFVAVPLKRALINVEQLPFPSGAAAAQTLRSLYGDAEQGSRQARRLVVALLVGLALQWCTAVMPSLHPLLGWPSWLALPSALPTASMVEAGSWLAVAMSYGWMLEISVMLPAAGILVGWRVAWSIGVGAVVCFGLLAPWLHASGDLASPGYRDVVAWSVWPGSTMMVMTGLMALVGRWPVIVRSFGHLRWRTRSPQTADDPVADLEVPPRWVALGGGGAALACIGLQIAVFEIPWWVAVLSVVLAVVLAVVTARVTGETDVTPTGPLGKLAQLAGGVALPGQVAPGLMVASVGAGAAASAADLLTDLKSGALLGAHPRRQFLAQLTGVGVGVAVVVPVFAWVVPDANTLANGTWPAPAARIWASVAELVGQGMSAIPGSARLAIVVAAVLSVGLWALERARPAWRPWLPSATGLGLAFVLPPANALSFFIGGGVAWVVARRRPQALVSHAVPIAAGLIAGESLMGIASALLTSFTR
ncbi:MAG: OPT/YSL family transporter [Deltaproteobacteria bacterium]|nr:OPT/YSL family transporter [Deltaproteobacteria bacterium]